MATPEGKVKAIVKKVLKKYEPELYQHWPVQAGYGKPCLDCHGCFKGRYFAIETKAPGKHPTPRQNQTIEEITEAGGEVFVIGSYLNIDSEGDAHYSGMAELEEFLNGVT